ncbi:hypothetical protein [Coleofasciculus sp. FACHB-1120]|nr:hypothetical protein [Coleofasciculus sp. FACHB-1120]MBD2742717.1 hypothetical protein [Coleofasciculus sp. FACHB-1120]
MPYFDPIPKFYQIAQEVIAQEVIMMGHQLTLPARRLPVGAIASRSVK